MNILLDMDGVLADFRSGALRANFIYDDKYLEEWHFNRSAGVPDDQFYANISADVRFWHDLKPYEWFDALVSVIAKYDEHFCIVTAPQRDPNCIAGKRHWLDMQFGKSFDRVMYGSQKHLMAKRGAVLIDDHTKNINDFRMAGGEAITFPQPWNDARACLPCDRVLFVETLLEQLKTVEDAP